MKCNLANSLLLLMSGVSSVVGCSSAKNAAASLNPDYVYEVVDPSAELKEIVAAHPPTARVESEDDRYAWERVELFFKDVIHDGRLSIGQNSVTGQKIVDGASAHYRYRISKKVIGKIVQYDVVCVAQQGGSAESATLNARNLARFISDGQLERKLLAY